MYPVFNGNRAKLPCKYEDMIFFADQMVEVGEMIRAQAEAHKDDLMGPYPMRAGIPIYDSLYKDHHTALKNLSDYVTIAYMQYPDYTGHE